MYQSLIQNQIKPDGFLVTVCNENRNILGMPVFSIQEITFEKTGIILGLNKFNTIEVIESLRQKGFDMDYVLYRKEFVRNAGSECVLNENPMIEVTTRIGCKVNCYYCPQELLLSHYYQSDRKRKTLMKVEDFKQCLDKLPQNCDVVFCGMSEPLLNPDCI